MVYNNILEAVGKTPLVRLKRMVKPGYAEVLVKAEGLNVGGSIKTRTALRMIEAAEEAGLLSKDSIICEPTSGNQGIGLALVGAVKGYRVIIIMPDSVSRERRLLMRQYGAEVRLVHDEGDIGKCIAECIAEAKKLRDENPRVFMPDQFSNPENLSAQREGTAREILEDMRELAAAGDPLKGRVDAFCSGIGTGGTLTGIGSVLKAEYPDIRIMAVEPEHAAILSGGSVGSHLQMGIGDGLIPDILDRSIYGEICIVRDEDAIRMSERLAREEGILCGISAGTNVFAALKLARDLGEGKRVVTVLPDTGERYFSTELFG